MSDDAHFKKFLQLPFLAQKEVIWKMGVSAFLFAKVSRKTSRLVKESKVTMEKLQMSKCREYSLILFPSNDQGFHIDFMGQFWLHFGEEVPFDLTVGDKVIRVAMDKNRMWTVSQQSTEKEALEFFSKDLFKHFKFSSIEVIGHDRDAAEMLDYCLDVYGPIFKVIDLKKDRSAVRNILLTAKTMAKIIHCNLDVLVLDLDTPERFRSNKPLCVKNELTLENAKWLTVENIKSINCEKINLRYTKFSEIDMNTVIRNILSGTIKTKSFAAGRDSTVGGWNINEVLKGITYQIFDKEYMFPMPTLEWKMTINNHFQSIIITIVPHFV